MENVNPSSALGSSSQEPTVTTHTKFTARINKLLQIRQTIDSLLFKTMNELTNQSSDSKIFCPEERIKELELRTQQRNNFEEELFKDRFPIEKELAYHKELLGEPQPPFSTLEPKIKRGLIRFAQRDNEVVFRMPQRTKELDLISPFEKDKFEAFFVENLKVGKKGFKHVLEKRKKYYKVCMNLGRT
ncbi:hypothetical protein Tco_0574153 [Tanacetum coccineum]